MSYKSEESKVYQGLNSLRKEFCAFRSEHNVGDIYSYMKNINYFFDKDDKPIDRMESLMSVTSTCKRILTRRVSVGIQEKRPKWNASLICSLCLLVL